MTFNNNYYDANTRSDRGTVFFFFENNEPQQKINKHLVDAVKSRLKNVSLQVCLPNAENNNTNNFHRFIQISVQIKIGFTYAQVKCLEILYEKFNGNSLKDIGNRAQARSRIFVVHLYLFA